MYPNVINEHGPSVLLSVVGGQSIAVHMTKERPDMRSPDQVVTTLTTPTRGIVDSGGCRPVATGHY